MINLSSLLDTQQNLVHPMIYDIIIKKSMDVYKIFNPIQELKRRIWFLPVGCSLKSSQSHPIKHKIRPFFHLTKGVI
jgi:hypothetical protein